MKTLGIDIGGTKIDIVEYTGRDFRFVRRMPAVKDTILNIDEEINHLVEKLNADAVGIGLAGWIRDGKILKSPNIPVEPDRIGFSIDVPFMVENDAACFAIGLYHKMYGERIAGITLGTGIGCGLVIDGKVLKGITGEIGHTVVGDSGLRCVCGGSDHLECYFSGWALEKKYGDVRKAFETGDVYRDRGFELLARSIASIIMLIDPDSVVVGGGMANSLNMQILRDSVFRYLPDEFSPRIEKTDDRHLPAKGAALLPEVYDLG